MTRPASLAGSMWADLALVRVELGIVDSWSPSGDEWDGATFDVSLWGESYLTPHHWEDVTADVESLDVDTGRNGVDDPGEVGTATAVLFDPVGEYTIAGSGRYAVGNLLRVTVEHRAGPSSMVAFHGKVIEATAVGDLAAPSTSVKAIDLLGALFSTDDADTLPAQSVTERLDEVAGRASVPGELRDFAEDPTTLIAVDKAGNRLDAARGAAASSVGGTLWAGGDGKVHYRYGVFLVPPTTAAKYRIGTEPGAICPAVLNLTERGPDIVNVYDWSTVVDNVVLFDAAASDPVSVGRFGRASSVRTDLLNADHDELRALVAAEIARTAWLPERVDQCTVPIVDETSAAIVTVQIGDLIDFGYTGSSPWSSRQLVGSYAHHIAPDSWTVDLKAYPAIVAPEWDSAAWDVDTWSLGAVLPTGKVA